MKFGKYLAAVLVLIAVSTTPFASPVMLGTTSNPTGFTGLEVDGVAYNVTFTTQSFDSAFRLSPPTFLDNYDGAISAAYALANALNTAGASMLGDYSPSLFDFPVLTYQVYIPLWVFTSIPEYDSVASAIASISRNRSDPWGVSYGGGTPSDMEIGPWLPWGQSYSVYAVFSIPESVPEPNTIVLICAVLLALIGIRKRRTIVPLNIKLLS